MVTEEKITDVALARYRLGTVLVWLGVITWVPFIVLRVVGEKPSLFLFLPFHFLGVVGGSRLRAAARKEMGVRPPKKSLLRVIGHGMIFVGILVWLPYFYIKLFTQTSVDVMNFLPYHLAGIFSGILVLGLSYLINRKDALKT